MNKGFSGGASSGAFGLPLAFFAELLHPTVNATDTRRGEGLEIAGHPAKPRLHRMSQAWCFNPAHREAIEASVFTGIVTSLSKEAFGRKHPIASADETNFQPGSSNQSFPSGHTTEALTLASVVAARSSGWLIPTLAYTGACLVAYDRVNDRAHFSERRGSRCGSGDCRRSLRRASTSAAAAD